MAHTILYHGSGIAVTTPELRQGRFTKDFGYGFYCTLIREQAERWAKRFSNPQLNIYQLWLKEDLNILEFPSMTEEWLQFVVDCRSGHPHSYDLVIGPMADDQIYNFISDYMDGSLTKEQFWVMARFRYPTQQMAFCSEKALASLKFLSCQEVSGG